MNNRDKYCALCFIQQAICGAFCSQDMTLSRIWLSTMHKRMTTLQSCLKCCRINIHGFNKDWSLSLFAHKVYVQIVQLADMSEEGNLKEILTNRKETIWKLSLAHMKFNSHTIEFVRQRNREYMTSTENWNEKSLQSLLSFLFEVRKFHAENH